MYKYMLSVSLVLVTLYILLTLKDIGEKGMGLKVTVQNTF